MLDESPAVRNMAFEVVVDLFKIYTQEEFLKEITDLKQKLQTAKAEKNEREVSKTLYIMMTVVLSCPYEIEEWMEELVVLLLETKKTRLVNEKFSRDFVVRFKDQHKGLANINQRALSYEVSSDLREISNPSSYFV